MERGRRILGNQCGGHAHFTAKQDFDCPVISENCPRCSRFCITGGSWVVFCPHNAYETSHLSSAFTGGG